MKSIYSFIVKPSNERRYDNIQKLDNTDFITSVSEEDHKSANRFATVVSIPINYNGEIKEGDTLLVHHNVFKFYNDMYGRRKSGKSYFKENLFFIDDDQFFLYKKEGKWKSHGKYCFVKFTPESEYEFTLEDEVLYRMFTNNITTVLENG